MQLSFEPARLTGIAILAVAAATTLSVGACSSSKDERPASKDEKPASSPAAAGNEMEVHGTVASVSGNAIKVTEKDGTANVEIIPSTAVIDRIGVQLADVAASNCVRVGRAPEAPGDAIVAGVVQLTLPLGGGKCGESKTASDWPLNGTVASVDANTINVTFVDANGAPAQVAVSVNDSTRYQKDIPATSRAIEQGKCIVVRGTKAGDDEALRATTAILRPHNAKGECP